MFCFERTAVSGEFESIGIALIAHGAHKFVTELAGLSLCHCATELASRHESLVGA